ncbi:MULTISPECIES: 2-succinyl-6-hydroxy-2,4-cyclohexadiene-1-carboxylate synthase [Halomonadaceae]|uniref:2-succinyl-6-hydroxy-2, 4-cyclohexadiene-1-carboxylate synthase n=1 Tax=Halomonadaceae TaxID=28256 RepID=UPI00159A469A|nr:MULTISPECIES: 2-succinyl-6-hydroxy-2,4-cyclohexadiene-1-carboxylate synthase [Halomonas]QJQ96368.1 2-succinyl-6-hydroxy-2,4-cyclohexadiene-1-carboxylate synthase [Halomonas sp. PA5]
MPDRGPTPLVFLHGLLGDREEWQSVMASLSERECHALDLPGHGKQKALRITCFGEAHHWLCKELMRRGVTRYRLVGYSLGGRLALYHASRRPEGLEGVLLESSHPGLPRFERAQRLAHDESWAKCFEQAPLAETLADWYRQPVFADLGPIAREQLIKQRLDNDPQAVAFMLRATSLGHQPDLSAWLARTTLPVGYVTGHRDHKFQQLAQRVDLLGDTIRHWTLEGGHNLHASQPERFTQVLREWLHLTDIQNERSRHDRSVE